jgi:hypothetical protein
MNWQQWSQRLAFAALFLLVIVVAIGLTVAEGTDPSRLVGLTGYAIALACAMVAIHLVRSGHPRTALALGACSVGADLVIPMLLGTGAAPLIIRLSGDPAVLVAGIAGFLLLIRESPKDPSDRSAT